MARLGFLHSRGFHLTMTIFWLVMSIPTALWWKNSILWVGEMSVYACMTTHWSSYQGARAETTAGSEDSDCPDPEAKDLR